MNFPNLARLRRSSSRAASGGGAEPETILTSSSDGTGLGSEEERALGDFTITFGVWRVVVLSVVVGAVSAGVALGLLRLIGLITHLVYFQKVSSELVQPSTHHLGVFSVFIPIAGGLAIGAMAYWGSERIRGHGIPEAMETILVGGSKVEPRLAVLKPISSAISIGTGGPFGAEGPIILTGGAFGSVIAQFFHLSAAERRTLLVAGSCGGMAAVFGTPLAAALFGVELLVFEWKPRSMVPIGLSCATAEVVRNVMAGHGLLSPAPLFPVPPHGSFSSLAVAAAALTGIAGGLLAWVLTASCYGAEDFFKKLPIHWAWWPAIGGAVIGLGGLVDSRALGVGYASINAELTGKIALGGLAVLLLVKLVIWSISLGSGTSGGILAPLLIMGAAVGGMMAHFLPGGSTSTWALMGMAATLAGVTRSPLTAIVFAFELTHDTGALLPLLVACGIAHLLSTLVLKRSILTEKVARRGFHVVREYQVEPLEALFVRDAMIVDLLTVDPTESVQQLATELSAMPHLRRQRLYPTVDADRSLIGVIPPSRVDAALAARQGEQPTSAISERDVIVAYADETLRTAADRMADKAIGALPVVQRGEARTLVGVLTEFDLLKARQRQLIEERNRQRILGLRWSPGVTVGRWLSTPEEEGAGDEAEIGEKA